MEKDFHFWETIMSKASSREAIDELVMRDLLFLLWFWYTIRRQRLALRRAKQDSLVRLRGPATSASSGFTNNRSVVDFECHSLGFTDGCFENELLCGIEGTQPVNGEGEGGAFEGKIFAHQIESDCVFCRGDVTKQIHEFVYRLA